MQGDSRSRAYSLHLHTPHGAVCFVHLQTNEQTNSESLRSIWLLLLDGEPGGQIWKQASHLDFKTHVPKNTPPSLGTFSVEPFLDAKKEIK